MINTKGKVVIIKKSIPEDLQRILWYLERMCKSKATAGSDFGLPRAHCCIGLNQRNWCHKGFCSFAKGGQLAVTTQRFKDPALLPWLARWGLGLAHVWGLLQDGAPCGTSWGHHCSCVSRQRLLRNSISLAFSKLFLRILPTDFLPAGPKVSIPKGMRPTQQGEWHWEQDLSTGLPTTQQAWRPIAYGRWAWLASHLR